MPGASHTHLLLFFRRSSPRRRSSLRLPLESNRVAHSDTRTDDTNEVVWRVNSVRERGVAGLIGSVARFLQPQSNFFPRTITMDRIVHAQRSLVIFMWQPIDGRTTEFGFHASFAIRFSLRTGLGYGATDLAGLLLRFTELYSELAHHSAHLLNFSYYSTLTMIYGVLIFDDGLNTAYQSVLQRADSDPMFMAPNLDIPMSTWPDTGHGTALLYDMQQINRMITITNALHVL